MQRLKGEAIPAVRLYGRVFVSSLKFGLEGDYR